MSRFNMRSSAISTALGPAVIEVPDDWSGRATGEGGYGEWLFEDPDDVYTLYIHTECRQVKDAAYATAAMPTVTQKVWEKSYSEVRVASDKADRGCVIRSDYAGRDEKGEIWHDARSRLIDIGGDRLVSLRFLFVCDAKLWNVDDTNWLIVAFAQQFDLVTIQLLKQFGFDCAANPGLLWRETTLDMGEGE